MSNLKPSRLSQLLSGAKERYEGEADIERGYERETKEHNDRKNEPGYDVTRSEPDYDWR